MIWCGDIELQSNVLPRRKDRNTGQHLFIFGQDCVLETHRDIEK
jgi:hypothetical protein